MKKRRSFQATSLDHLERRVVLSGFETGQAALVDAFQATPDIHGTV